MDDLRAGPIVIPADELELRFTRASGPGGQNVNKRSTRVEVVFDVSTSRALDERQRALAMRRLGSKLDSDGRLRVAAEDERTQAQNRARALDRLAATIAAALRPPPKPRRKTKPSRASTDRRISEKKARGQVKRARRTPGTDE